MKEFVISEAKAETAVLVGLITPQQGEAKAKEWLLKNGFLQLVAIDSVIDKDENAEEWLLRNHFEVDLAFARAINCDDDATEWLEKRDLQVFVIIAKKIRKYLDDKYLDYHKIHF